MKSDIFLHKLRKNNRTINNGKYRQKYYKIHKYDVKGTIKHLTYIKI